MNACSRLSPLPGAPPLPRTPVLPGTSALPWSLSFPGPCLAQRPSISSQLFAGFPSLWPHAGRAAWPVPPDMVPGAGSGRTRGPALRPGLQLASASLIPSHPPCMAATLAPRPAGRTHRFFELEAWKGLGAGHSSEPRGSGEPCVSSSLPGRLGKFHTPAGRLAGLWLSGSSGDLRGAGGLGQFLSSKYCRRESPPDGSQAGAP